MAISGMKLHPQFGAPNENLFTVQVWQALRHDVLWRRDRLWDRVYVEAYQAGLEGSNSVLIYRLRAEDEYPNGNLIIDAQGNLYGSTSDTFNGCNYDCGTVYKTTSSKGTWVKSVVHTFDGPHGASPDSLLLDKTGHFYGSTLLGTYDAGTIFELKPEENWKIKILYNFTGERGDANPNPGLLLGSDAAPYETTPDASGQFDGAVFEVLQ